MPAVLSKVRDDVAKVCTKLPAPALYGCAALTVAAVGAVGYKIIKQRNKSKIKALVRKQMNGVRTFNNNYSKILLDCLTPTACAANEALERCDACKANSEAYENIQNPTSPEDDGNDKLLKSIGSRVPGFNIDFIMQLLQLLKIMVPKLYCRETGILTVHTLCLFTRTFLSIYVASMEGHIVKYIVKKDLNKFLLMLLKWFGIAIPATFINSMIRYLENRLALAFRTRLVDHAYKMYFKNQTYYRVSNLDDRIENADHRLTDDICVFASSCAHLYSHLTKPCFDLLLIGITMATFTHKMKANIIAGPVFAVSVVAITGNIIRILSPKFGQLVSEEAQRYGYLRHIHSRIIAHAEEIAFYGGHKVELHHLSAAYQSLVDQMNTIFGQKLWFVMLEQFFMKYVWSGTGMVMVAIPILVGKAGSDKDKHDGVSERSQYLTVSRNLLNSAADAVERLMSSYKEIVALAGYTNRVASMMTVFEEAARGKYLKTAVDSAGPKLNSISGKDDFNVEIENGQPIAKGKITFTDDLSIDLIDVPIVTPNCDVMVSKMNLHIEPGQHLIITGPNGCGKSSLFRIVSGLWPVYSGELKIPQVYSDEEIAAGMSKKMVPLSPEDTRPTLFYIPQRPYMSIGTLLDQVIYPETHEEFSRQGKDAEIKVVNILKLVCLDHILHREGLHSLKDWRNTLSGGEKQRMAMARLFYHRPHYALLDECTSAVSLDTEVTLYESAIKEGITLLSITHRPSLWKYHKHILEFDGVGNWSYKDLTKP